MARLKVKLHGQTLTDLPLAEDREYVAGRKETADIVLKGDRGLSREHFKLVPNSGTWKVIIVSKFGELHQAGATFKEIDLEHGMAFSVPPYEFEFLLTSGDSPVVSAHGIDDSSATADHSKPFSHSSDSEAALPVEKTVVGVAPSVPYIKMTDSSGEATELIRLDSGETFIAGRDSACQIVIKDQRVSRRQFEIRRQGSTYTILDLQSVNGTLLNGNPVSTSQAQVLKSGDAISVLENYMYFELHDPNFKTRLDLVQVSPVVDLQLTPQIYQPPVQAPAPYDPYAYAQHPVVSQGALPQVEEKKGFDFQKHRPRLILATVAVVAIVFAMNSENEETTKPLKDDVVKSDPLSKMNPEQKKLAKDTLQLAKSYYMQAKYEFARSEMMKLEEILNAAGAKPPFEDSDRVLQMITEAINVQQMQKKQEELERVRAEQEDKIQRQAKQCRQLVKPGVTQDQMDQCLGEVVQFQPDHPLFEELRAQVSDLQAQKAAQEAQRAAYQDQVSRLKTLYSRAKKLDDSDKPLDAIEAYEKVIAASLPDPESLKSRSSSRIKQLRQSVNQKTANYQEEAKKLVEAGDLKGAILALRKARQIDPDNPYLLPLIQEHKLKLQEEMMILYQEGILEESFGNIEDSKDGAESKATAKQKWREILKRDVADGEYYKKAFIKLKKYGSGGSPD